MKPAFFRCVAFLGLLSTVSVAFAADELAVQVSGDGLQRNNLTLVLDGDTRQSVDKSGLVFFDLTAGAHSLQVLEGDDPVYTVRFDTAKGQLTDALIRLSDERDPASSIDSYYTTETAAQRAKAPTGRVQGRVTSGGAPVIAATVELSGATSRTTTTDSTGRYSLEAPRGNYTLTIVQSELGTQSVPDFRIIGNVDRGSDFTLRAPEQVGSGGAQSIDAPMMEEVLVLATLSSGDLIESERYATNVVNTLDVEQLARYGDSNVASAIIRVPSVTVQDGQFVFIRGLGDRYVSSTLNGATMPSTNPSKRSVPLDLFPSSMVEQLDIRKTFIATMPGESTGGNLEINTRTFPDDASGKLNAQLGYVDGLTFDDAFVDRSDGAFDIFGWDDGTRKLPATALGVADALRFSEFYPPVVRQQLGSLGANAIKDDFNFKEETAAPDVTIGGSYGDLLYLDRWEADLGYFVAGQYKNEWNQRTDGISRSFGGVNASRVEDDFTFEQYDNDIEASALISVGLIKGNSSYTSNTIASRVTQESVRAREGRDGDERQPSIGWSILWEERQFLSQQFTGEHVLGEDEDWTLSWQGTASQAKRDAPDRREVRFDLVSGNEFFTLETEELTRRYDELVDDNYDATVSAEYLFSRGDLESVLDFGVNVISRDRDSDSATYGFLGGELAVDREAPNLQVSEVVNSDTITGNPATGFTFQDKTLPSDSYDGKMDLNSVYASYDALWNLKYQLVVGARYEEFQQTTDTFSLAGAQGEVQSKLEENSVLPTLAFNWFLTDAQQLRFAVSQTVARPDFKETANATFFDEEFDFRVRGNPDLQVTDVINYDARWEYYWTDQESVSIALFYKDLSDPIERVVQPASGTAGNSRTFQNAESAELYGVEVDLRKDFAINEAFTKSVYVAANGSYIDSQVTLLNEDQRKLQGAPDYTMNIILGYDDLDNGQELTVLFNQVGDTIVDVGVSGQPDVIQKPSLEVDLVYKYFLSDSFTVRVKLENILDSKVEFTQGGNTFQSYKTGYEVKAAIEWTF